MKFVHIADVHLGMVADAGMPWSKERAFERMDTLRLAVHLCNNLQVDLLLIAGDLFHRHPLKRELDNVNYLFSTLEKTHVVIIAGNRDYLCRESNYNGYEWCEQVVFISQNTFVSAYFEDCNTEVTAFSYDKPRITKARYNDIKPGDKKRHQILLAHGGTDDCVPVNFDKLSENGFDYAAFGHIHIPQILKNGKIAYCGSLEPTDRNDTGERGCIIGTIDEKGTQIEFRSLSIRQYISIEIELVPGMTINDLKKKIADHIQLYGTVNIYKIKLKGSYSPEDEYDISELMKLGNIICVEDESCPEYDFDHLYKLHKNDVVGKFINSLTKEPFTGQKKKALYYGLNAMMKV